ncbi:hypothetical protein F3Y22_tig00110114pilonHSYRG00291 [Hibiscus syriacus]|uniref:Pentatricopeptide repeat-containing protein n=1 Tax=Hibiscus syriacus TaxID=106335 RepID=A0A6A3BHR1_HIBSY|nr:hypothetical protein F3Y22_tig00110114pilonHSYRG00291 [Hibiscus syriacus]
MANQRKATHLDLVAKVQRIPSSDNYFVDLPESSKNHLTYGILLNCYRKELMTENAESLMEKMKEPNIPFGSMSYNSLMTLYMKIGQPERTGDINMAVDCVANAIST